MQIIKHNNYRLKSFLLIIVAGLTALLFSCSSNDNVFIIPDDETDELADHYEIHFIDVGQGDAIFVLTPGKNLLIDGGWPNTGVVEYLEQLDIEKIDIVIGTHPHADHIGGLINVFHAFEVDEVIDPAVVHTTATFNTYMSTIDFYDIPFTVGRRGIKRELSDNAHMVLLHPVDPDPGHLNNASVVARVTLGEITLLLTGDAEREAEQEMLEVAELLSADILKVGHHGSWTSSNEAFLEAVQPTVSVIMCGIDNDYGHPHDVAIERLKATGTEIYRTDLHGHVLILSDGINYSITTEKNH